MNPALRVCAGVALFSLGLMAQTQTLPLAVNNAFGSSSGSVCDPWSCQPAPVTAPRGWPLQVMTQGFSAAPDFLLLALPPAQCTPIPGFAGSLIVQPPGVVVPLTLGWGHFYVTSGPGTNPCGGWIGFANLPIPATAPTGFQFLLQLLREVPDANLVPIWTFSNAVVATIV